MNKLKIAVLDNGVRRKIACIMWITRYNSAEQRKYQ